MFTGKVELGQGILTALRQIAAEELDLPLERIAMISGDTGRTPNEGQTAGSQSVENSGTALRMAGAEARAILLELAAKRLGVGGRHAHCRRRRDQRARTAARSATASSPPRSISSARRPPRSTPKPVASHRFVGKSIPRTDIPAKVTGGAAFVQDVRLPGMVHGRVVRPPSYGATLERVDEAAVKALPGVIAVVRDGSFLGVVAEREEQAIKARAALAGRARSGRAGPELPDPARIYDHIKSLHSQGLGDRRQAGAGAGRRPHARGDLYQALPRACLDRPVGGARRIP